MNRISSILNITLLMQKKYLVKENTNIEIINKVILFFVLSVSVIFLIWNTITEESLLQVKTFFWGFVFMFGIPIFLYNMQYKRIKKLINGTKGKIISRNTEKIYKMLPKGIIIYSVCLIIGVIVLSVYISNLSNIEEIKLKALVFFCILGMGSVVIKAYIIDRIVVFSNESFISGFDEVKYISISSIKEVKRFRGVPEDLVTIEFFFGEKSVGFDKLLESDYINLLRKILEINRES